MLICGVCKNVESALPNTISSMANLGAQFKDFTVIIYENNSTDRTAQILAEWASKEKRVVFISENLTQEQLSTGARCYSWDGKPSRMEIIARARNIVLSKARAAQYADFDYVIMADLDFQRPWPIPEILNSIQQYEGWDCIAANGMSRDVIYYDRFALRNELFPFGPELIGEETATIKCFNVFMVLPSSKKKILRNICVYLKKQKSVTTVKLGKSFNCLQAHN